MIEDTTNRMQEFTTEAQDVSKNRLATPCARTRIAPVKSVKSVQSVVVFFSGSVKLCGEFFSRPRSARRNGICIAVLSDFSLNDRPQTAKLGALLGFLVMFLGEITVKKIMFA
ncbi:MAG: hypothetical protein ABIG68_03595, partial [Acidobacteriota bacterium]